MSWTVLIVPVAVLVACYWSTPTLLGLPSTGVPHSTQRKTYSIYIVNIFFHFKFEVNSTTGYSLL
jgi:hypothetical protein